MKKILVLSIIALLCTASAGIGYVYGGSNLGFSSYPEFDGWRPSKPYSNDQYEADRYRRDVAEFRDAANEYAENANNDIQRIREASANAIDEANSI